jgi:hypothetical protein
MMEDDKFLDPPFDNLIKIYLTNKLTNFMGRVNLEKLRIAQLLKEISY